MLQVNPFSLLVVLQKALGVIKTCRFPVVILVGDTDVVGLELRHWHFRRCRQPWPFRRCRQPWRSRGGGSDSWVCVLQVESLELCSPVASSDTVTISSQV